MLERRRKAARGEDAGALNQGVAAQTDGTGDLLRGRQGAAHKVDVEAAVLEVAAKSKGAGRLLKKRRGTARGKARLKHGFVSRALRKQG